MGLGIALLCQRCKWEHQADILTRRPDLRSPTGIGIPTGGTLVDGGLPLLHCDTCNAGWPGTPFMDCPWCLDRAAYQITEQSRMERTRYNELLGRLRDGDLAALPPALHLASRLNLHRQLARALAQLQVAA